LEGKNIKKRRKNTLKWFLFIVISVITIFTVVVNLTIFQSYLGRKVSEIVTNQIKTPIKIERVKLGHFLRIEMKNVRALDEYYDTLLKANKIAFTLSEIDRDSKIIRFSDLNAQDLHFHLIKHKGDSVLNIDYITERLKDTTSKDSWGFQFNELALSNSRFRLDDRNKAREYEKMDFSHLDAQDIDARIQNLSVINDTISAWVQSLDAMEQSGFVLNNLETHLSISPTGWKWDFVDIETPYSELSLDFVFDYYDYKDLSDFVNSVYISAALHDCSVSMTDMKYFIPPLEGINNTLKISGDIQGRIDDISSENMVINYGRGTRFLGDFAAKGLPDVENTFFDAQIREFTTNSADIQSVQLGENDTLILPEPLNKLERLTLKGAFLGEPLDFSSNAQLKSNLGDIQADITMAKDSAGRPHYNGSLSGDSLLLGVLAGMPEEFGSMNFNTQINGNGLGKDYQANLNGYVNNLHFRGNRFDSLSIYGEASSRRFSGNLRLRDDNLSFDFSGLADLRKSNARFDFSSNIQHADLRELKIVNRSDSLSKISADVKADFTGNHLDSISGYARISDLKYTQDNFVYRLDSLTVSSTTQKTKAEKSIKLRSDFMDGDVKGVFRPSTIVSSFTDLLHKYLPSLFTYDSVPPKNQNFTFDFHLKDMQGISQIFLPSVNVSRNSRIHGSYNSASGDILLETNIGTLSYNDIHLNEFRFHSTGKKDSYQTSVKADNIILKEYDEENIQSLGLEDFELSTSAKQDFLYYDLKWDDKGKPDKNKALVKGTFNFDSPSNFTHRITQSNIRINDTLWQVDRRNYISVTDSSTTFSEFSVFSDHQQLLLNGTLSDKPEDSLRIDFSKFDLSDFDMIYAASDMDVDGILNGYMQFSKLAGRTTYTGDINIDKLAFNGEKVGEASFYSAWVDSTEQLYVRGDVIYKGNAGQRKLLDLEGGYWPRPREKEDSLRFSADLNNFSIEALYPLLDDFLDNIDGWATGKVNLAGSTQRPALSGELNLTRGSLKMGYLNTTYYLADKIQLRNNAIVFDSVKIYDDKGNPATLDGKVTHNYFKDFALDLHLDTRNFAGLNTTRADNDLFYGKAFATGQVDVTGPVDDIQLNVAARTEPNTNIVIPISTAESVMENDFVIFVSNEETEEEQSLTFKELNFGGLNMNFSLEITPDAKADIILPFSMGRISGRGGGNLEMEITSSGEFNMYGDYIIEEGSFLFTLQNMLRRNFSIERGSTISWNGNPYNAILDISAVYKVRPTLNLPAAESYPELASERVPVNCIINLKDKLFNPNIKFDIALPSSDARVKEIVYSSIDTTNRAEMNRQMIYLLVLNSFSVSGYNNTFNTGLGASSLDLLSNQISSWLSQISQDLDIGINYRPGDTYTSEELAVALSTQLFNDRVSIDGNFGVTNMQEQSASRANNLVGDINIDVKITKDGRFRVKAFNQTNNVDLLDVGAPYTQGLGVFYRKEFDNLSELFRRKVKADAMRGE